MDKCVKMMANNTISIRVPMRIKKCGGKKMIILPEGYQMTPPQEAPKQDETLVTALAKAYYWQSLLDTGRYKSIDDMSRQRQINSSYMSRILRLNQLAPIRGPAKTILFSTGAEAVENAVKIARKATGRSAVVAFSGGFHGRSFMAMALTGKTAPYKRGFGPMPGEVFHVPFPVAHQGIDVAHSLKALQQVFKADVAADEVAAIIIEPVQGEGGFHIAPPALLQALREIAHEHGIVLIADEVQSGFARTGRLFGIEHSGIQPDLITVAKSLAGGFPLSGVIGRAELMDAVDPGGLGGTYAGSPVACAAALAVLEVIDQERLVERAGVLGKRVAATLEQWTARSDLRPLGHVRALGSMIAFDLLEARGADEVDALAAQAVLKRAHALGLILLGCGAYGEAIRILFPLTIGDAELDEGMALLEQALAID